MERKDFRAFFAADRANGFAKFDKTGVADIGCAWPTPDAAAKLVGYPKVKTLYLSLHSDNYCPTESLSILLAGWGTTLERIHLQDYRSDVPRNELCQALNQCRAEVAALKNLQLLDIVNMSVSQPLAAALARLPKLLNLDLDKVDLALPGFKELQQSRTLEDLSVTSSNLRKGDVSALSPAFRKRCRVNVYESSATRIPVPKAGAALRALFADRSIGDALFDEDGLATVGCPWPTAVVATKMVAYPKVKELNLGIHKSSECAPQALVKLLTGWKKSLDILKIMDRRWGTPKSPQTSVLDACCGELTALGKLSMFEVTGVAVSERSAKAIAQMPALESLKIAHTNVSLTALKALGQSKSLLGVCLHGTGLVRDDLAALSPAFRSRCKVEVYK